EQGSTRPRCLVRCVAAPRRRALPCHTCSPPPCGRVSPCEHSAGNGCGRRAASGRSCTISHAVSPRRPPARPQKGVAHRLRGPPVYQSSGHVGELATGGVSVASPGGRAARPLPSFSHGEVFGGVWHGLGGRRPGTERARGAAAGRRAQRVEVAPSPVPLPRTALAPRSPPRVAHLVPATSEAEPLANNLPLEAPSPRVALARLALPTAAPSSTRTTSSSQQDRSGIRYAAHRRQFSHSGRRRCSASSLALTKGHAPRPRRRAYARHPWESRQTRPRSRG